MNPVEYWAWQLKIQRYLQHQNLDAGSESSRLDHMLENTTTLMQGADKLPFVVATKVYLSPAGPGREQRLSIVLDSLSSESCPRTTLRYQVTLAAGVRVT